MRYRAPSNDDQERWRNSIKGYRQSIGLSIEGMAKALGIPAFRLDKIEKGIQPASEELEAKACALWEDHMDQDYEESRAGLEEREDAPLYFDELTDLEQAERRAQDDDLAWSERALEQEYK